MKRAVVVAFGVGALLAVCAGSALASPPEFGRCVKVAIGTGTFATANCTTEGGEKKFEWVPGPGPKPGFALTLKPEGFFLFEGKTSKSKITCTGAGGSGNVTGPATVGVSLVLTGCETSGVPCNSKGLKEKEVALPAMTGELGVIKNGETALKNMVGLSLGGEWGFECGGPLVTVKVTGSAIGAIAPTHAMALVRKWTFKVASKTRQVPEHFEGGLPQVFEADINGTTEQIGFGIPLVLTSEEKIEINTVY